MNQAIEFRAYRLTTAILALWVAASSAAANVTTGRVVHVIGGASLVVLVGDKRVNVRLEHVDAPERGQPYAHQSRQSLIAICGSELAKVHASGKDRSGRTLARVHCNGVDAGAEQVRRGMAWVFDGDAPADSPLYAVQDESRAARRGLWSDSRAAPTPESRGNKRAPNAPSAVLKPE